MCLSCVKLSQKNGTWEFHIPGADVTSTFYHQFMARLFTKVPQNIPQRPFEEPGGLFLFLLPKELLRNLGDVPISQRTIEEHRELFLFPNISGEHVNYSPKFPGTCHTTLAIAYCCIEII